MSISTELNPKARRELEEILARDDALHEVAHNAHREASEGAIRRLTMNPDTRYSANRFNLKYHGRN